MMTVSEILGVTGGKLLSGKRDTEIGALAISSKEVKKGSCFVAIKGKNNDGNEFIDEAVKNGATVILSEKHPVTYGGLYGIVERIREGNVSFVLVEDIYSAVKLAAKYYREKYLEKVIAVTGSVGKTTVKELIYSVLSEGIEVYKTEGNKNNHLGLPISIISGNKSINAVLELGISNVGEMQELSEISAPSISVITNIGSAHIEYFLTRESIAAEKLKIVSGMKNGGTLIINGDEPLLTRSINFTTHSAADNSNYLAPSENAVADTKALAPSENAVADTKNLVASESNGANIKILTVSEKNKNADIYVCNVSFSDEGTFFDIKKGGKLIYRELFVPITGKHGAIDAAFAVAVAELLGCSESEVRSGLKKFTACGDRQRLETIGGISCIFDCYNASPESFAASLDAFKILADVKGAKSRGIVAGSMLELGDRGKEEHKRLGEKIYECSPELLITVGAEASFIAEGGIARGMKAESVVSFPDEADIEAVASEIKKRLPVGAIVLIKGSRGMRLECLREHLN